MSEHKFLADYSIAHGAKNQFLIEDFASQINGFCKAKKRIYLSRLKGEGKMYKEQREHFMGSGASQMDENVLAKRIDMNGAGNAKPGSFFVLLIPIVIFVVIATVFFNDFRFSGNFFFFWLVAGFFVLVSILGIVTSTKMRKAVKKAPIAVRVSSDFTLDLFLDNGQRKTVYANDVVEVTANNTPMAVSYNKRQTMSSIYMLNFKLRSGETIRLNFIDDGYNAKTRIDAFLKEAQLEEF